MAIKMIIALLLISSSVMGQEADSLIDRRFYDTLGKHYLVNYTYAEYHASKDGVIYKVVDSTHQHFPAHIEIIEYYANRQKVVWVGSGIYSEEPCASDNAALWIRRYLQTLNKK